MIPLNHLIFVIHMLKLQPLTVGVIKIEHDKEQMKLLLTSLSSVCYKCKMSWKVCSSTLFVRGRNRFLSLIEYTRRLGRSKVLFFKSIIFSVLGLYKPHSL